MQELRLLLYPFSILYNGITGLRNMAFNRGILNQHTFKTPTICVGNLSTGGTGKTPMVEWIINKNLEKRVAVLSRGYGRKTSGFRIVSLDSNASEVGDEPLQIKTKFKDTIDVAVCEDRVAGVQRIIDKLNPDLIILDDAFQHRHIKADTYVMLTAYHNLFYKDHVLPAGNLRESRCGYKRAQIIIVTKCPSDLSDKEKLEITKNIKPQGAQKVFFSTISYQNFIQNEEEKLIINDLDLKNVTVITGIAYADPFINEIEKSFEVEHLAFKDHHEFTEDDIKTFKNKKFIITTEKDYMRLKNKGLQNLFYLAMEPLFIGEEPVL